MNNLPGSDREIELDQILPFLINFLQKVTRKLAHGLSHELPHDIVITFDCVIKFYADLSKWLV